MPASTERYQVRAVETADGPRYAVIDVKTGVPAGWMRYSSIEAAQALADWRNGKK